MFSNKDGLRLFEGRFNEIISNCESRASREPEDWTPTSSTKQIDLKTAEGETIIITAEDDQIQMRHEEE